MTSSFQCKAIFFSEQERQQHTCLNTPRKSIPPLHGDPSPTPLNFLQPSSLQAKRNSPVMFTNSSPQNLVKPHHLCTRNPNASLLNHHTHYTSGLCDCSKNHADNSGRGRAGSFCICSSCGKTYENSGDSLSDFDLSVDSAGISGHKCPNSPSVRGLVNDLEGKYISCTLALFKGQFTQYNFVSCHAVCV